MTSSNHEPLRDASAHLNRTSHQCLVPSEVSRFVETGDLPKERLDHFETCEVCGRIIEKAAVSPPSLEALLLGSKVHAPTRSVRRSRMMAGISAVAVCLILFLVARMTWDSPTDQGAVKPSTALDAGETAATQGDFINVSQELTDVLGRPPSEWSEDTLLAWLSAPNSHLASYVIEIFRIARKKGLPQGISKAILVATLPYAEGWEPVLEARHYLAEYSDEFIVAWLDEHAANQGFDPKRLIRRFLDNRDRVRTHPEPGEYESDQ